MSELKTALENSPWRSSRNQLHRRMNPPDDQGLTAIGWANVPDGVQLIASSNNVLSLACDSEYIYSGHPWGVAVYDHRGKPVTRIALGAAVRVLVTSHDCVWVGTPAGLFRIVRQDWSVAYQDLQGDIQSAARFRLTGNPIADRWIFSSVWDLAVDGDSLWIGTQRNVQRLNMQTLQLHVYSQSELGIRQGREFERIEVDEKYVWAASSSLGIRRYDRATDTWAATDSIGPRAPVQFVDIVDGRVFGDAYVNDTRQHRLCVIDPVSMSVTLIPLAQDDASRAVSWPMQFNGKQNGELIFGGFRFDAAANQMVVRTDSERETAADRQGDRPARNLTEPSHAYIFSLHDKIDQSLRHQRRPALRDGVTVDLPDGRRVLGLRQNAIRYEYPREDIPESNVPYDKRPGGLFVVGKDVTEISAVPASDAIHGDLVQGIGFGQGEAWVCTSAGIAKLDQNNHVRTTFTRRDGLIHECVTDAAEKFGKWYFATGRRGSEGGLAIFDPETTIFTSLTTLDGLPINSIKSIRSKGDQLELTVGHERRQGSIMSDLNCRTYPPLSFDPRTNRLGPIGEPILMNERDAMSEVAKGKVLRVPLIGGHQVQKVQHNGHTYLCGTRGLVIIDDDGGDEQNPPELIFTDLKVKIVSSQIDQLIADAESRKSTFDSPEQLVQALKDPNGLYRANALAALLTKGNPLPVEYLPAVASQLQDKNVRLRSTALFLLTRFADDKQVVPLLKAHLDDEAQHSPFATIELAKRGVMPDEKYRQEVRGLGHRLHGNYPWGANSSIHVDLTPQQLAAATAPHADADHFAWLLKSPPRVGRDSERSQTFVQLGKRVDQDPNSLDVLLNAGSTDYELDRKQIEFVMAVFHNANPEILTRLHRSLSSKDRRVRSNAALACGVLKDPSSIEPLIKALDLESLLSRKSIVWSLGELKAKQALPVLYDLYGQAKPIPVMAQAGDHPPKSVGFDDLPLDNLSGATDVKPRLVDFAGNSKRVYSGSLLTPGDILNAVAKIGPKYSQPFYRSVAVSVDVLGRGEAAERLAEAPVKERAESIVVLKKLLDGMMILWASR